VLAAYLITGTTLAISRVWLYVWMVHRYASHTVTETVVHLQRCFYPEALLADYTRLSVTHVSRMQAILIWGSILTLESFIIATPILLLGWLMRKGR
jgi:hypothetical protein